MDFIRTHRLALLLILSLNLTIGTAQISQSVPFRHTGDAIVIDNTGNQLYRFMDLNLDGDWNDAGEIVLFFATAPGITLSNPSGLAVGPDGVVYVSDSTTDQIIRLQDFDGDGVATSAGEATVFFSAALNASLVTMPTAFGLTVSSDGVVWVSNANTTSGTDSIIRLADGNGNMNAQDAGEAVEYATFAIGLGTGISIPSNVVIGVDGAVYFLENGTGGKGVYRLHDDVVPNGVCTDAGEVTAFYLPTPPAATPTAQYWGLASDRNGNFYVAETAFDRILRVKDLNADQTITLGPLEESVFYAATPASNMWQAAVDSNGVVYVVEDASSTTPDRIYRLQDLDLNGDATSMPGESATVYDDTLASVNIGSIRSIAFLPAPYIKITPNPLPLGGVVAFETAATSFGYMNVFASLLSDSVLVPPYGTLGISIADPGLYFELIPVFTLGASGSSTSFLGVPTDPILLNATFYLQAVGGPAARLQLSNVEIATFQ